MTLALTALAFAYGCLFGAVIWAGLTAPEGWEDDDGFHFGPPELPDRGFDGHPLQNVGREHANRLASPGSVPFHAQTDSAGGAHDHAR